MARTTSKVVAPSSATKGKVADKPATTVKPTVEATQTPAVPAAAGVTTTGAPAVPVVPVVPPADAPVISPVDGVALPVSVASAVLALVKDGAASTDADALAAAELAAAEALAAAAGDADTVLVDDVPVLGFTLPVVTEFPVTLTLTNAWQGRHDVAGTNETLAPGETRDVEFTESGFKRFSRQIIQLADLHGWKEGQGVLIEQGADHGED